MERNEKFDFNVKAKNLVKTLKSLMDGDVVTLTEYSNLQIKIWKSRTIEDLSRVTKELAEICQRR